MSKKLVITILLLLCLMSTPLQSKKITLSSQDSLILLEKKLEDLEILIENSDENSQELVNQLKLALESARKSEGIISAQDEQLKNVSKSLEDLEKSIQKNKDKHILEIKDIERAHRREIRRYKIPLYGLAGGTLGGLAGYVIGDSKGAIIGGGSGAGIGIILSFIF